MAQKSVLITGCSSGIGYAAAHGLRNAGWPSHEVAELERVHAHGFSVNPDKDVAANQKRQDELRNEAKR